MKRKVFPYMYEVSKSASQQAFRNLGSALKKIFRDLKKVKIPRLGLVRMREKLRFNGEINNAVISENAGK